MKKVLFVIRTLSDDGAERALSNIITHFPDDWEIDLLLNNYDLAEFPYKGNLLSLDISNTKERKSSPFFVVWEIVKRAKYLRRLKKENGYDACVSFLDSSNISNVISGSKYCKTIISIRVSMISKESKSLYRYGANALMRGVYNRANKIVAVSKEIEEDMKLKFKLADKKITSIVNGYDYKQILKQSELAPEHVIDTSGRKLVVTVGRLNEQKGQWHLIRAFKEVIKKEPTALLLVLGTGELQEYYETIIRENDLQNHVILGGYCKNPFWYEIKADVFVLPSMYEGFPNVLAEAICCEVPCIATDFHSGAREILAPDMDIMGERVASVTEAPYGVLTPLCSGKQYNAIEPLEDAERQLADAVIMMLSDEAKNQYYRKQSKIRRENLSIDEIVQEWIRVIEEKN
ncbi:MAG: glycosyltransferase [Lachnospiraceae bacterium]|nr:glycosyltransferase [Lachnospiraceae bacterium]